MEAGWTEGRVAGGRSNRFPRGIGRYSSAPELARCSRICFLMSTTATAMHITIPTTVNQYSADVLSGCRAGVISQWPPLAASMSSPPAQADTPDQPGRWEIPGRRDAALGAVSPRAVRGIKPRCIRPTMHPRRTAALNRPQCKDNFTKCHVCFTIQISEAPLCVAPRSNSAAILPRRALPARRLAALGADAGFIHGLPGRLP